MAWRHLPKRIGGSVHSPPTLNRKECRHFLHSSSYQPFPSSTLSTGIQATPATKSRAPFLTNDIPFDAVADDSALTASLHGTQPTG